MAIRRTPYNTVGEGHITILPFSYDSIGQGTWTVHFNSGNYFTSSIYRATPADGDNISYKVYLDAGTYTLRIMGQTWSSAGITDIYLDAVEVASFDWYNAAVVRNALKTQTGITVSTAGLYTFKLQVDGKNASSLAYGATLAYYALWRTA